MDEREEVAKAEVSGNILGNLHAPGVLSLPFKAIWPLIGIWTMHVWIFWFNTTNLRSGIEAPWWFSIYAVMTCAMMALFLLFRHPGSRNFSLSRLDIPLCVIMVLSAVGVCINGFAGKMPYVDLCCAVTGGICMSWGYLRWAEVYATLSMRDAVACLALSYIFGSSLKIILEAVPAVVGVVIAIAIPITAVICLRRSESREVPQKQPAGEAIYVSGNYKVLVRVGVSIFFFIFLARLDVTLSHAAGVSAPSIQENIICHAIEIVLAVAALVWVFGLGRDLDFPMLWRFVFLFYASAIVLMHFGPAGEAASHCLSQVAVSLTVMLLWLFLVDVSHHCPWHPVAIFGLGWCAYVGATWIARIFFHFLEGIIFQPVLDLIVLWSLSMVIVFLLGAGNPDIRRFMQDVQPMPVLPDKQTLDQACARLAQKYGLTERELEVFKLLARGRSKAFIAEKLVLSENTIRGHSKRIYAKLGIHTREQLQSMLDE